MKTVTWKAEARTAAGKGAARKVRAAGNVPAVAYGKGFEPTAITLEAYPITELIRTNSAWTQSLINLEGVDSLKGKTFMIRELQRHHIKGTPIAMDLLAIRMDQSIKVMVPLDFQNSDEIKKLGGILDILSREVEVQCLPTRIPSVIEIDVAHLGLGHTLFIKDVKLPEGVTVDLADDYPLATVVIPRGVEEPKAGEEEAAEGVAAAEGEEAAKKPEAGKEKTEE